MNGAETKAVAFFTHSAAGLLLAMASALFLINLTAPVHLVQPHDPIFGMSLRSLFWIIGGMALWIAFFCLFSDRPVWSLLWIAWLAANFLVCRIALYWTGCRTLAGFLGSYPYAFGISANAANALASLIFAYLLIGSLLSLAWRVEGKFVSKFCVHPAAGTSNSPLKISANKSHARTAELPSPCANPNS